MVTKGTPHRSRRPGSSPLPGAARPPAGSSPGRPVAAGGPRRLLRNRDPDLRRDRGAARRARGPAPRSARRRCRPAPPRARHAARARKEPSSGCGRSSRPRRPAHTTARAPARRRGRATAACRRTARSRLLFMRAPLTLPCAQLSLPPLRLPSPGGGIGRRARLRILCPQGRAGSTPVPGTDSGLDRALLGLRLRHFVPGPNGGVCERTGVPLGRGGRQRTAAHPRRAPDPAGARRRGVSGHECAAVRRAGALAGGAAGGRRRRLPRRGHPEEPGDRGAGACRPAPDRVHRAHRPGGGCPRPGAPGARPGPRAHAARRGTERFEGRLARADRADRRKRSPERRGRGSAQSRGGARSSRHRPAR